MYETSDQKCDIHGTDIEIAEEMCSADRPSPCSPKFTAIAEIIMMEEGLQVPQSGDESRQLYLALINEIEKLM